MQCRIGCAACCVELSISSPIPGMPQGKLGGDRCVQLNDDNLCRIFGDPSRPAICNRFTPQLDACGTTNAEAYFLLSRMERATS
jgi:Fe-S-cluster containining protein